MKWLESKVKIFWFGALLAADQDLEQPAAEVPVGTEPSHNHQQPFHI